MTRQARRFTVFADGVHSEWIARRYRSHRHPYSTTTLAGRGWEVTSLATSQQYSTVGSLSRVLRFLADRERVYYGARDVRVYDHRGALVIR